MVLTNNKKIKTINFSDVYEYLYDEYLEYIKRIDISFINTHLDLLLKIIIENEQIELLKYILLNCEYKKLIIYDYRTLLLKYTGKNNPKEILEILLKEYHGLLYLTRDKNYFTNLLYNASFELVQELYKIQIKPFRCDIYSLTLCNFKDKRIFYWLIDNKMINLDFNLIEWLKDELGSIESDINSDNIDYLLEKINFNKSELDKIFFVKTTNNYNDQYVLTELLYGQKDDLIYYFFKILKPEQIIALNKTKMIFKYLIIHSDYKMFMFMSQHIILLKYDDFLDDPEYCDECINDYCNKDTDKRIVYELVKLGCKINKDSKYYNDYKNIKIISNNA